MFYTAPYFAHPFYPLPPISVARGTYNQVYPRAGDTVADETVAGDTVADDTVADETVAGPSYYWNMRTTSCRN
jgi:hypothetical protein